MMIFNFTVGFYNGTEITDDFNGMDDFNLWVKIAIKDFGEIVFIKLNDVTKAEAETED